MPEKMQKTVCPLWTRRVKGYDLVGSSVLCGVGEETFLISAAHVLDQGNENLFIGTPSGFFELTDQVVRSIGRGQDDRFDVGFIRLNKDLVSQLSAYARIPAGWSDRDISISGRQWYRIFGCPWRKVEKNAYTFYPQVYHFDLQSSPAENHVDRTSPETHIALEFIPRKMLDGANRQITAPNLEGVSGGPVWKFIQTTQTTPEGRAVATFTLAGIAIEHRRDDRLVVATRIFAPMEAIRSLYPELSQFIPENPLEVHARWERVS